MKGGPNNNWNVKRRFKAAYRIVRVMGEGQHESGNHNPLKKTEVEKKKEKKKAVED
jgi:hypothetical protein